MKVDSLKCVSCDQPLGSRYCANCGEKKIAPHEQTVKHFLAQTFALLTNVDNTLFRSFKFLLFKPGYLTAEYMEGRRKLYLRPIQLFLIANVIFFLFQSLTGIQTFNPSLKSHMYHQPPYRHIAAKMVENRLAESGMDYDAYEQTFNIMTEKQAKTFVILMIPFFAVAVAALYWRQGRFLVEHLIFSIHFYAFYLLYFIVFIAVLRGIRNLLFLAFPGIPWYSEFVGTSLMLLGGFLYMLLAFQRLYQQNNWITAIKSLAITSCLMIIIYLYRMILFFTCFYSI